MNSRHESIRNSSVTLLVGSVCLAGRQERLRRLFLLEWRSIVSALRLSDGIAHAILQIQALLILNHETTYHPKPWHGTLLVTAVAAVCGIFNTFLARKLPLVEGTVLILHIVGFFAILIPLWILAPRSTAQVVFTDFTSRDEVGWPNIGIACLVGILSPTVSLLGSDAATHMSEELQVCFIKSPPFLLIVNNL